VLPTLLLTLALSQTTPETDELSCADCHEAIVESYARSGMARALGGIRPGELRGLSSVTDAQGTTYRFEGDGPSARIVETRERGGGKPPFRDSATLAFAIGAGVLDRSYVAEKHGRMWFAPLEVVSETESRPRHAALAPPHTITPGSSFTVPVTRECLACHTDTPPPRDWPLNATPSSDSWTPTGISCAACHTGGEAHMDWRMAELSNEERPGPDPILNPARLPRTRSISVCAACHLQGDARIELKPGTMAIPPPGSDLLEHREVFVAAQPTQDVGFVSHVERLVLSRCYLETSSGPEGLQCTSCHNPHRTLEDPLERRSVRAACASCHADETPLHTSCALPDERRSGQDCVDCHMRRSGVFDVEAVTIHDHWIRKRPGPPSPPGKLRFPESPGGDWKPFRWPDVEPPAHHGDPGLRMMALYHGRHVERAGPLLERPSAFRGKLAMLHHVRAVLFELSGRIDAALAEYREAIRIDPDLAESVSNLGLLHGRVGNTRTGLRVLDGLLARHPEADGALRNRALIKRAVGDSEGFLSDLEAAMGLLPSPELARALSGEWQRLGRMDRANYWRAEAERLER